MTSELLPCPFCGGESHFEIDTDGSFMLEVEHESWCFLTSMDTRHWYYCETAEEAAEDWNTRTVDGEASDGYHTFNELYHHRAVLFSKVVEFAGERAWKSKLHADGTMYDGFFIVGVQTPEGQATYHYAIDPYWEMFDCKEVEQAPVWDGHTPQEAIERIAAWNTRSERTCSMRVKPTLDPMTDIATCSACGGKSLVSATLKDLPSYCPNCGAKVVH